MPGGGLVEREAELALLDDAVQNVLRTGSGRVVLIEGESGIGKTALMQAAADRAAAHGLTVSAASGTLLERDYGYGVVRQLLERRVRRLPTAARARLLAGAAAPAGLVLDAPAVEPGAEAAAVRHALYWVLDGLTDAGPLALVVDDAHWSDAESLRWLSHVARRLNGVPVLLVLAVRDGDRLTDPSALDDVRRLPFVQRVRPAPLTSAGVAELARCVDVDLSGKGALTQTILDVTGGNPFYVEELVVAAAEAGGGAGELGADEVVRSGGQHLAGHVVARIGAIGDDAGRLAAAVAVLGTAELRTAAAVAALPTDRAAAAADRLRESRVLGRDRSLCFAHDVVRLAVLSDVAPAARAALHKRAARALDEDPATADAAALHLLHAEPDGDPRVVTVLRAAADRAMRRASPEQSVLLLERALAEPVGDARGPVLASLGHALTLCGRHVDAEAPLREAAPVLDDAARDAVLRDLAEALLMAGRPDDARAVLVAAAGTQPGDALPPRMAAELGVVATAGGGSVTAALATLDEAARSLPPDDADTTPVHVLRGYLGWWTARWPAHESVRCVDQALAAGLLRSRPEVFSHVWAALTLWHAGQAERSHALFLEIRDRAIARGASSVVAAAEHALSRVLTATASLDEAEALARPLLSERTRQYTFGRAALVGGLLTTLVELGRLEEAEQILHDTDVGQEVTPVATFHLGRIALRSAQGRHDEALDDVAELRRRCAARAHRGIGVLDTAADALLAAGRRDTAAEVARAALVDAERWGTPSAVAPLRRVLGQATGEESQLRTAAALVAGSVHVLEDVRCRVTLGAHLRRAGHRAEATTLLRAALDLAHRSSARLLAERAAAELRACGARPRRNAVSGVESLTPAELRTAELAARGLSNPRIAQTLFVSRATVETHLSSAFRKLAIASRAELAGVLEGAAKPQGASMTREVVTRASVDPVRRGGTP